MPDPARKSLSVLNVVYEKLRVSYESEKSEKSFVKWVSDYLLVNLEKDEFVRRYAPFIHRIGFEDNVLYLRDSKKKQIIEIRLKDGKLQSSEEDPIYLQFAMALPELARLKV